MTNVLVTTVDNPFNPFTEFDEWYGFDRDHGYNTCEYLARIALTSDELSDDANAQAINDAVDEIVRLNINGMYKKVTEPSGKEHTN